MNKIDKSDADPERVRNELAKHEVIPEEWGGQSMFVNVSARTGEGMDKLLEAILLQAEVLELKAPRERPGQRRCNRVEHGEGPRCGRHRAGQERHAAMWAMPSWPAASSGACAPCSMRAGNAVSEAAPRCRWWCWACPGAPNAGDELLAVESERKAREVALYRQGKSRDVEAARRAHRAPRMCSRRWVRPRPASSRCCIKTDVQGSAEALRDALNQALDR